MAKAEEERLHDIIKAQSDQLGRVWEFLHRLKLRVPEQEQKAISCFLTGEGLGRRLLDGVRAEKK